MLASLIVPTHNKAPFLARTLASLARQDAPAFEVVVVDDGSDDDTREVARSVGGALDLRYLRRAHMGRAAARNAGVRSARGDLLIFCDDDRLATPGFVREHIEAHTAAAASSGAPLVALGRQRGVLTLWSRDWNVAAVTVAEVLARRPEVAGALAAPRAELVSVEDVRERFADTVAAHAVPEPWWERYLVPILDEYGPEMTGFAFPWTAGVTGNLSTPRALAEQVGLFDEAFVGWGLEDTDFHFRLHGAGAHTRILDGALSYHQIHARPPEQAAEWGRNAVRLLEKYDSLEICLYLRVIRRRLALAEANRIAHEVAAGGSAVRSIVAELVRLNREHVRMLVQATP
ncbi:MAG TPA: glycosyltransferase [Kofleriaceae bacterium]|nr:glycosyltransferase [Kofleriaceae bacterium]